MALIPEMMCERIKAIVIVQATPLNRDGSLDLEGLKANTRARRPPARSAQSPTRKRQNTPAPPVSRWFCRTITCRAKRDWCATF